MPFPLSLLIMMQLSLGELSLAESWGKFVSPIDGLNSRALRSYGPVSGGALKLVFYIKSGSSWQGAGDPDAAHWSGYRTISGEAFRYAQARASVKKLRKREEEHGAEMAWSDAGLIENIATCIPARCLPDFRPVMELEKWEGEKPRVRLRYRAPVDGFSQELVRDSDPMAPGREGDYGAILIDEGGFERIQRGVDICGKPGETLVFAAALGRVVLLAREGASASLEAESGEGQAAAAPAEYGNCVYVAHPDGYTVRYANLGDVEAALGQGVLPGTRLGTFGGGAAPWVHIEVRWGDPLRDRDSVAVNPWEFFGQRAGRNEWR